VPRPVGRRARTRRGPGGLPRRDRCGTGLPLHPRHRLGRGALVPSGRHAQRRIGRRPVPGDRAPRHLRRSRTAAALEHPTRTHLSIQGVPMPEAYIIDAIRTPSGKRGGALAEMHPADMGAHVIRAIVERNEIDPATVDDVIFGCVDAIGGQAGNIARTAWLAADMPEAVPGTTVDRQCGSSQQAIHFAAQAVMSGTADIIVAGGLQNMSQIPISAAMIAGKEFGFDDPFTGSAGWVERYGTQEVSQFRGADLIAEKWDISREDIDRKSVV